MRTWDASTAGSSFPTEDFAFTVHSVFARAVNLRPGRGALLSLVADGDFEHPRAALVPEARFDDWGVSPGGTGSFAEGTLFFDAADAAVNLPAPRRSAADEAAPRLAALDSGASQSLKRAAAAVAAIRKERGAEAQEPFAGRLDAGAQALENAAANLSVAGVLETCRTLVGLGPGLTPAADDFLCGWLAGLRAQAYVTPGLGAFLDEAGAAFLGPPNLLAATSDISAAFLGEALHGRFASALVAFARAALGVGGDLDRSVGALAAIGHSSGTDAALGFLFAFGSARGGKG